MKKIAYILETDPHFDKKAWSEALEKHNKTNLNYTLMKILKFILRNIFNMPKTIYFNFHYLPFRQAIKLPIFLFNARLVKMKGSVKIEADKIKPGMIRLGLKCVSLYYNINSGIIWENRSSVVFKGKCSIGHNSAISTGKVGYIEFGDNFVATSSIKITSFKSICFGENSLFSWENIVMDTDFHRTIDTITGEKSNILKPIIIGKNNWFGVRTIILKGTQTPDNCTFSVCSILNKKYDVPEYSIMGGNPLRVIKQNAQLILNDRVE